MNPTWQDELDEILSDLRTMIVVLVEKVKEQTTQEAAEVIFESEIPADERSKDEAQDGAARSVGNDDSGCRIDMGGDFARGTAGVVLEAGRVSLTRTTPEERRLVEMRRRFHGYYQEELEHG